MRIGHGYDVHAFTAGDHLMLGGVRIAHNKAFRAHSDGDVLLHAVSDALLGAAALGDIGVHFPDTDERFKDVDSRELLRDVVSKLARRNLYCCSVDSTLIAQAPKLAGYLAQMKTNIAADLDIPQSLVNVKATTTEQLGFCGREEGIAAHAVVLLQAQPVVDASA